MGRDALAFKVQLAELDVAWMPAALDATIRERVNRELKEKQRQLTWNFSQTLSYVFALPTRFAPSTRSSSRWPGARCASRAKPW